MTTITVLSAKGGASKTTLTLCLASASRDLGKTTSVLDTDPSESAARWANALDLPHDTARSAAALRHAHRLADSETILIDTPPLYEDESAVKAAIALADVVLVPLNPSPADIDRLALVTPLLTEKQWYIVITQERPTTKLGSQLRGDLANAGLPCLTTGIPSREAVRTAWGASAPDPLGGSLLWRELDSLLTSTEQER